MCLRFKIQDTGKVLTPENLPATQSAPLPLQPGIPAPRAVGRWPWNTWLLSYLGNVKVVVAQRPLSPLLRTSRPRNLKDLDLDTEQQIFRVTLAKTQP